MKATGTEGKLWSNSSIYNGIRSQQELRDATAPRWVSTTSVCLVYVIAQWLTCTSSISAEPDPTTKSRAVPIYATTVWSQPDHEIKHIGKALTRTFLP
jgi:hypothetical protein